VRLEKSGHEFSKLHEQQSRDGDEEACVETEAINAVVTSMNLHSYSKSSTLANHALVAENRILS